MLLNASSTDFVKRALLICQWSPAMSQYPTSFLKFEIMPFPLLRFCGGLILKTKTFIFNFFIFVHNNVADGWNYRAKLQTNVRWYGTPP